MLTEYTFIIMLVAWCVLAVGVFVVLLFIPVPYGKIRRKGWGPEINSSPAWMIMESVSWAGMLILFLTGINHGWPYPVFFILWMLHYVYRALLFPFLRGKSSAGMPVTVMCSAMCFNSFNVFFNGYWLFHRIDGYGLAWCMDIRFVLGVVLFAGGFIINVWSDRTLKNLRQKGDLSYKIPCGGLFRFVSCPNYLGEIIEWIGWAVMCWSPAGAAFALWTIANLAPRAISYHAWYRKTFDDYPKQRKALIPFIL